MGVYTIYIYIYMYEYKYIYIYIKHTRKNVRVYIYMYIYIYMEPEYVINAYFATSSLEPTLGYLELQGCIIRVYIYTHTLLGGTCIYGIFLKC